MVLVATTEELAAAHRLDLREAGIGSAAATYSAFVAPRRSTREQVLAQRVAYEQMHRDGTAMSAYVPVLRSEQVRMVTLCVF